ncbi:TlpA family protein disulfide reductase [Desulfovirgula thermocuniculi]|uniref:TlpA family protein disulfide reductase n=1 Tax=Desulfovirgula thermocuniculi TaxID=348842 RepID=UPI0004034F0F|nr:TlpA disulfide reductase family protein [Desulfovirgula thermocuniculi]
MSRIFFPLAFLLGAVLLLAVACWPVKEGGKEDPGREASKETVPGAEVGRQAPDFTLPAPDGKKVTLSSLRGKPVVLNFWATWCPPCREEMPAIQEFYRQKGREVEVLAVNLTSSERSPGAVQEFLKENGYTFPVLLDGRGEVAGLYLVRAIPTTFFLDGDGVIRYRHTGPLTLQDMLEILAKLPPSGK